MKLKGLMRSQIIILAVEVKRDSNQNYVVDALTG